MHHIPARGYTVTQLASQYFPVHSTHGSSSDVLLSSLGKGCGTWFRRVRTPPKYEDEVQLNHCSTLLLKKIKILLSTHHISPSHFPCFASGSSIHPM